MFWLNNKKANFQLHTLFWNQVLSNKLWVFDYSYKGDLRIIIIFLYGKIA